LLDCHAASAQERLALAATLFNHVEHISRRTVNRAVQV
jgi:hypothetical protein